MRRVHFLTHPDVVIDPSVPITDWPLAKRGRERLARALTGPCFDGVTEIHASRERKATDAADMAALHLNLPYRRHADLSENDRSSTGYLPREEFERTADRFFQYPDESTRGWTPARDEQARIIAAVRRIAALNGTTGTILIISHGAVGALLLANLASAPISRSFDQPGDGGGNWFAFDVEAWSLIHGWRAVGQRQTGPFETPSKDASSG